MKNYNRSLQAGSLALASILGSGPLLAAEVTENLCNPTIILANESKIQVNGVAKIDTRGIVLTETTNNLAVGTAFYKPVLTLRQTNMPGTEREFHNYFRMKMGATGLYGVTSIVHSFDTKEFAFGSNGDGLGFGGIAKSVVYELDNHDDASVGLAHLSLMLDGNTEKHPADATNLNASPSDPLGQSGTFWGKTIDVWIDYDHTKTPRFVITLQPVGSPNRTVMAWQKAPDGVLPADLDLSFVVGDEGWVGFTSSTGLGSGPTGANEHVITRWQFSNEGPPCGCPGDVCPTDSICDTTRGHCVPTVPGCKSDADCPNDPQKPRCDTAAIDKTSIPYIQGVCVPCIDNMNCGHITDPTRPLCLMQSAPAVNECVECLQDSDCPAVCDETTHSCVVCIEDADCPFEHPRCRTTTDTSACDFCNENANCARFPEAPLCGAVDTANPQKCVPCNENPDCKDPALPVCDKGSNQCVVCVTNNDCKDPELPICDTVQQKCTTNRFIAGGGCGCSLLSNDGSGTAAVLAALVAAAAGLSRRRRRS